MLQDKMGPASGCSDEVGIKKVDQSVTFSMERKDAMRIWLEMKANGFLTPSIDPTTAPIKQCKKRSNGGKVLEVAKVHNVNGMSKTVAPSTGFLEETKAEVIPSICIGAIPTPKQRSEKRMPKKKLNVAKVSKVQQENRFIKVADSSGLLDDLNPGILSRIRNSEQVFSVIEALVRMDDVGNINVEGKQVDRMEKRRKERDANECLDSLLEWPTGNRFKDHGLSFASEIRRQGSEWRFGHSHDNCREQG